MSWPTRKLGDVCDFVRGPFGGALKKECFVEDGYAVYEQQHAIYNQFSDIRYFINQSKFNELKRFILSPGDLIMSCSGTMGKIAIVPNGVKTGIINQALLKLTPSEKIDINYLKYWLESESFQFTLNENTHGAAIKNVASVSVLKAIEIPLPPLAEQKRIAAILDNADAIRRKRQQAIQLADDFLSAVFLEMFGDPVTNPKGWETKTIDQLISDEKYALKRGPFGGALKKEIFIEKGYLVYEQYHALNGDFTYQRYFIDEKKFQELKGFEVKPKDIIVSCSGVNLGRLAEVPPGSPVGIINQALMKITLNERVMLNELFIDIFSNPSFKTAFYGDFRGAAIPNFPPMSTFREFKFIVPPLELQQKYVRIKSKMSLHSKDSIKMDDLKLFDALSQRAFSGQL